MFKKRITEVFNESEMNQKEIADALNVTPANLSNWKNGRNLPSIPTLKEICKLFNVSADYLIGLSNDDEIRI